MSQIRIKVVRVIRDPLTGRKLEPGVVKRVSTNSYWLKRKKLGDVELCEETKKEVAPKVVTKKGDNSKEGKK